MAPTTFLWGTEPKSLTGMRVFLWGVEPQYSPGDQQTSTLGHSFGVNVAIDATSILGHSFTIVIPVVTSSRCGHRFTIPSPPVLMGDIDNERSVLLEDINVQHEEPPQVRTSIESVEAQSSVEITEKQRIEVAVENFQQFIRAAEEMQNVLGERLKNRVVKVDPKINPDVREAIRRLFGINSDEITYDMFKKCLALRSAVLEAGRKKYGAGN